jgi:hypothetical protein
MEQGFVVDQGPGFIATALHVSTWAAGRPRKSWFRDTHLTGRSLPIGTFRCPQCGFLESYARPEFRSTYPTQFSLRQLLWLITVVAVVLGMVTALVRWVP